jgi:hypothetical protein
MIEDGLYHLQPCRSGVNVNTAVLRILVVLLSIFLSTLFGNSKRKQQEERASSAGRKLEMTMRKVSLLFFNGCWLLGGERSIPEQEY